MSYRQLRYDPLAATIPGRPLRPFNWVQWVGVGFGALAILWLLLFTAEKLGWLTLWGLEVQPATMLALVGAALVNSRRGESTSIDGDEQRRRNSQWLMWTVVVLALVAGVALIAEAVR